MPTIDLEEFLWLQVDCMSAIRGVAPPLVSAQIRAREKGHAK